MKMANIKVGTRLMAGFGLLLVVCGAIGLIGVQKMGAIDAATQKVVTDDWAMVREVNGLEANLRVLAADTGELLIADSDERAPITKRMSETRRLVTDGIDSLETFLEDPAMLEQLEVIKGSREQQRASLQKVEELAMDNKTLEEAVRTLPILMNVSRYHAQVLPFLERFGHGQVLILQFDQLMNDREATLARVAAFAGLDPGGFPKEAIHSNPSIGGNKTLHWADSPPRWARWVRTLTPAPVRERMWKKITRDPARTFSTKPELSAEWKEAVIRLLENDILALERITGSDLTSWWHQAGLMRPEQRAGN